MLLASSCNDESVEESFSTSLLVVDVCLRACVCRKCALYVHAHTPTVLWSPYMCTCSHLCVCIAFSGSKNELKVKRLILWSQTALGRTLGYISTPPTPTSNQPNRGVINNTPSITLCTQMGRQVEGWWRTARCVVLHPIIQIRVWTSDSAPLHLYPAASRDLYPSGILPLLAMPFVTAGPCWRLLLKNGRGESKLWFWVIYEVLACAYDAVVLQCLARGISKSPKLSKQITVDRSVSHLQLSALYHCFHSHWTS